MRKVGFLALGAVGLVACTSILGDFSVGDGGTTDGGNDVQQNDVVANDVASDVADSGPDVQPVKLANCSLATTQPTVFLWPNQNVQIDDGDRVFVFQIPQKNRLFVQHNNAIYYADFNDQDQTASLQTFSVQGQIISSTHVNGPTPGTVFIIWDYTNNAFTYAKWLDTAGAAPTIGTTLVDGQKFSPDGGPPNQMKASITAIDLQADDYLFAIEYSYDPQGKSFSFATGHAKGGALMGFAVLDTNTGPDLNPQMISHDPSSAYFWVQPGSNGNVPNGPSFLYIMDIPNWTKSNVLQLQPQNGFYVPMAMANGGLGITDVAFLEGDLTNQNAVPLLHAQAIQTSSLPGFKPQNVPSAPVAITALPFNKGVSHWLSFPSEDDWIGAGRPIGNNGLPGVNILWFDSKGNARAIISESDGGGGFPSGPVDSIDMTFNGQPSLVISGIRAAWIEGQGSQQSPKVISMQGQCTTF